MRWGSFLLAISISAAACHAQSATEPAPATPPAAGTDATQAPSDPQTPAAPAATTPSAVATPMPVPAALLSAAIPVSSNSYVIGPTDVITLTVLKEPTLSSSLLVRPDGMITMPLLGDVKAVGLTPLQLSDDIAAKLKKYIQDPNVSVVLTAINSKKVYMMGEVAKVGPVDLAPGMTLLEALANAGGVTEYANTRKMYILRNEDGKHTKIPVRYKDALKGNSTLNVALKPGDTIVVP